MDIKQEKEDNYEDYSAVKTESLHQDHILDYNVKDEKVKIKNEDLKDLVEFEITEVEEYKCPECDRIFNTQRGLSRHTKISHSAKRQFYCAYCPKVFRINYLEAHLSSGKHLKKDNTTESLSCDICQASVKNVERLNIHRRKKHNICHKCNSCGRNFINENTLKSHIEKEHGTTLRVPEKCPICDKEKIWKSKSAKERHIAAHSKMENLDYECKICSRKFALKICLLSHMTSHTSVKAHVCTVCKKEFKLKYHLVSHMTSHDAPKKPPIEDLSPKKCLYCPKVYNKAGGLSTHMKRHHRGLPRTHCLLGAPPSCTLCKMVFKNMKELKKHSANVHANNKKFQCASCDMKFPHKYLLEKHFSNIHIKSDKPKEKIFSCPICPKKFSRKSNLYAHRVSHSTERPFLCKICNKTYKCKDALRQHLRIHTGCTIVKDRGPSIECQYCKKEIANLKNFKRHLLKIHPGLPLSKDTPFVCMICEMAHESLEQLKDHVLTHAEVKRYKCKICSTTFIMKYELMIHKRNIHMKIERSAKEYKCPKCDKKFEQKIPLKIHYHEHEATDTTSRPYECALCTENFIDRESVKIHMKIHRKSNQETIKVSREKRKQHLATVKWENPKDINKNLNPPDQSIIKIEEIEIKCEIKD